LLASACSAGAYSACQNEEMPKNAPVCENRHCLSNKDDLFDYGNDAVGKPTGNDIKEKLTLPLIYT
jgi:octaprenyl-diphosphate synthase